MLGEAERQARSDIQENLQALQARADSLEREAKAARRAGDRDQSERLARLARDAQRQAGTLAGSLADPEEFRRAHEDQIRAEAGELRIQKNEERRVRIAKTMRELTDETGKILTDSIGKALEQADSLKEGFRNIRDSLGTIIPNHRVRAMGGAGGNVFHFKFNIESTDGPGVEAAIERARPVLVSDAVEASRAMITTDIGRTSRLRGLARG